MHPVNQTKGWYGFVCRPPPGQDEEETRATHALHLFPLCSRWMDIQTVVDLRYATLT